MKRLCALPVHCEVRWGGEGCGKPGARVPRAPCAQPSEKDTDVMTKLYTALLVAVAAAVAMPALAASSAASAPAAKTSSAETKKKKEKKETKAAPAKPAASAAK
jgi:hypothetical protein